MEKSMMNNSKEYYDKTEGSIPHKNIRYFVNKISSKPGNAIELGCGVGIDSIYLIKNDWNVLATDVEDTKERISGKLNKNELKRFRFKKQSFEEIELEKNDLILANNCLSFCDKNKFDELWRKIENSIVTGGYFVGNFFGVNDDFNINRSNITEKMKKRLKGKENMKFFTKEEVERLFEKFKIIEFKEIEKEGTTGMGTVKYWHIFWVIAKKV